MSFQKIAVLGLGKIGHLVALTLNNRLPGRVIGVDTVAPTFPDPRRAYLFESIDVTDSNAVAELFGRIDAVVSCLPYFLNIQISTLAHSAGIHYFDLTEDVPTTNHIRKLAETSKGVMAPQCGLAPGFIGIVGADLIKDMDLVRSLKLRVGALPQNPTGLLGYSFNWSPEGVVNEYLNDSEVIEGGARKMVSSMEWKETISIQGQQLEAFTTSGGLGTMCETLHGRVANLDYKTMRYPGHMDLMNFFFHELLMRDDKVAAQKILTNAKPQVEDDYVFVHASAEGIIDGKLRRKEFVRRYAPIHDYGERHTAIAWTTAYSIATVVFMVSDSAGLKVQHQSIPTRGFIHQEHINLKAFTTFAEGYLGPMYEL